MRTRTRLTSPAGTDPATSTARTAGEVYVPAFALPTEPRVARRSRRLAIALGAVAIVAALLYAAYLVVTAGQDLDPALEQAAAFTNPGEADTNRTA